MSETKTPYVTKLKAKEQRYAQKQAQRALESLTPEDHTTLKSALSQAFCGTSYLIGCVDTICEIMEVKKHYPLFGQFQAEMEKLNSELYALSVKNEADDLNRIKYEKTVETVLSVLPRLDNKNLEKLAEIAKNLE